MTVENVTTEPVVETPAPQDPPVQEAEATPAPVPKSTISRASDFVKNMLTEKAKFKEQQEIKRAQEARETAEREKEARLARYEELKANAKKDPSIIAKEFQLSSDDFIRASYGAYSEPKEELTPEQEEDAKFEAKLEKYLAPFREKAAKYDEYIDRQRQAEEEQVNLRERLVMENISSAIKSGDYPWLVEKGEEGRQLVREILYQYWETNKVPLSYADACATADTYYDEEVSSLVSSEAFKKKHSKPVEKEPEPKVPDQTVKKDPKSASTLTHKGTTQSDTGLASSAKRARDEQAAFEELKKRKILSKK